MFLFAKKKGVESYKCKTWSPALQRRQHVRAINPRLSFLEEGGGEVANVAQLLSPFSFLGRELAFSGIKDIVKEYFPAVKLFDYTWFYHWTQRRNINRLPHPYLPFLSPGIKSCSSEIWFLRISKNLFHWKMEERATGTAILYLDIWDCIFFHKWQNHCPGQQRWNL